MPSSFRVVASSYFERDLKKLVKRNPSLFHEIEALKIVLESDPYNVSRRYNIKKLTGVKAGQGQWRIRLGDYRLRYDIFGHDVVLYILRHRKDVYSY